MKILISMEDRKPYKKSSRQELYPSFYASLKDFLPSNRYSSKEVSILLDVKELRINT